MREVLTRKDLQGMRCEDLDELIYEVKGEEATTINKGGRDSQVDYLMSREKTVSLLPTIRKVLDQNNGRCLDTQEERNIVAIALIAELIAVKRSMNG